MMRLRMAFRNLWRNPRRTLLCLAMISAGFLAIVMFRGFTHSLVARVRSIAVNVQFSHIQVGTSLGWSLKPVDDVKVRYLENHRELTEKISGLPEVTRVVPRLNFFALISTQETSVAAQAIGIDPIGEKQVMDALVYFEGQAFLPEQKDGALVATGLANQLGLKPGDTFTLVVNTLDGAMNAMDLKVSGIVTSGLAEFDRWTFYLPIYSAQKVLDTNRVERLAVYLKEPHDLTKSQPRVDALLGDGLETRNYRDLSDIFRQTEIYFQTQNRILAAIILALVSLSILNIIGNSVVERTGEIGTMRALGDQRSDILKLFFLEGLILALLSCVLGSTLGSFLCTTLSSLEVPITIPGAQKPMPLAFDVVPMAFIEAAILTILTSTIGSVWPARRAANLKVVESLRRNLE